MVAYEQIQRTLQRIEDNLAEPLDIQSLAAKAYLSPYYFQRLFTRLVGRPIADYQKQRRLASTVNSLLEGEERIVDIALRAGFQSHETYTRAFKEAFGMTPDEFRRSERQTGLTPVLMPDVALQYTLIKEEQPLVADGVVLEVTRRRIEQDRLYAGFRVHCPHTTPNGLNPGVSWNYLDDKLMRTLPYLHPQGDHAGIGSGSPEGFSYLAGCQVTQRDPDFCGADSWPGFESRPEHLRADYEQITAGEYLILTFTAEDFSQLVVEAMDKAVRYLLETYIPGHGLKVEGPLIEIYDERSLRWHPAYRLEEDAPHLAPQEPKLSQWEGPEMELQIRIAE